MSIEELVVVDYTKKRPVINGFVKFNNAIPLLVSFVYEDETYVITDETKKKFPKPANSSERELYGLNSFGEGFVGLHEYIGSGEPILAVVEYRRISGNTKVEIVKSGKKEDLESLETFVRENYHFK